ncbi:SIS domain-containing protein [Brevundimonas sp. SORGH_AS_0993]|uniref:SIS domain-containing protein n=1 Tax=Brevundimonas sp. SORGH_AS_0993 TaxID=3041794 RepID=UPI00278467F2|nr:SIS domain-containing protein [Brevundimonas sp. SORGH_AS_0993]MDQ1155499.1 tagatose-6-phosphate ketose/aldose isomerase [Brevundimonas sp. SORGH_AS_0993]
MTDTLQLGLDEAELERLGGLWTAREIAQQPAMLRETQALLMQRRAEIEAFLQPILDQAGVRIILTGAGTSAFAGECLAPALARRLGRRVEAIATTDLVCAPHLYFEADTPTLLVSFGRSGNSPESVAAIELADRLVSTLNHLVITCNADGALARYGQGPRGMNIQLPEATHDRSFAMTSSFSCMTYAALAVFSGVAAMDQRIDGIARATQAVIARYTPVMQAVAGEGYQRVVYLGSHIFKGLARESGLKLLELTNGALVTMFDSPLGFRHGPKTIVNDQTLIVVFFSNDAYTRSYDVDLLDELRRDNDAARVIAVTAQDGVGLAETDQIKVSGLADADDVELLFAYIAAPQILAFFESLRLGLKPDKPNAAGTVNRVVQGVRIHELT